ncbi:DUF1641 domain-containing protein [Thermoflavimicrobium dichotomicum]|uniref:Uncharacterized conserved protein YjgD, DUF1641 family n=1 Tax=Thermoflavimicrobium dichotomicum TaxID=46223 RepID=A0A1I3JME2_9BACL|nr:DUF1641 domain-containing protein [Thermoflavimicrobium dichotomicum]SFI61326.1 Uncharacterized conserved protein YjgD, DUF1641 family [Thermoflavimicrobium dichotomicum]
MAQPISKMAKPVLNEEEQQKQSLEKVLQDVAKHADGIRDTLKLLQELHESGILEALHALVEAREKVAKIAVGQMLRPPVTHAINNLMAVAGVLAELDPKSTETIAGSVAKGLKKAEESVKTDTKVGLFDLIKALKDPDINRAIVFGLHLLKGMGEGLKQEEK